MTTPGARNGQRVELTRGPNRLIGRVSSDSVSWITLRLDSGCSVVVDLEGWAWTPVPDGEPEWPAEVGELVAADRRGEVGYTLIDPSPRRRDVYRWAQDTCFAAGWLAVGVILGVGAGLWGLLAAPVIVVLGIAGGAREVARREAEREALDG